MSSRKRELIPVSDESSEASLCMTDCNGACCRAGVSIAFFPEEAKRMEDDYGAKLSLIGSINLLGYGFYLMLEDCPNLSFDQEGHGICGVWEEGWRPLICSDFKAGSPGCEEIRRIEAQTQVS